MSAVEHKHPGFHIRDGELNLSPRIPGDHDGDDWGIDVVPLSDENFSYALGSQGSTRRKLSSASGCIIDCYLRGTT